MNKQFNLITTYLTTQGLLCVVTILIYTFVALYSAIEFIPLLKDGIKDITYILSVIVSYIILVIYLDKESDRYNSFIYLLRRIFFKKITHNGINLYYTTKKNGITIYYPICNSIYLNKNAENEINISDDDINRIVYYTIAYNYERLSRKVYKNKNKTNKLKININGVQN